MIIIPTIRITKKVSASPRLYSEKFSEQFSHFFLVIKRLVNVDELTQLGHSPNKTILNKRNKLLLSKYN